jgi:hypothetical protein
MCKALNSIPITATKKKKNERKRKKREKGRKEGKEGKKISNSCPNTEQRRAGSSC